jgi:hypothetical protein
MTTYQETSISSKLTSGDPLSVGVLGYFRERQRLRLYELVMREFLRTGITKAELARRMGRKPEQITRWLGAPGNWTLDTISDLLLAISGGELSASVTHPFAAVHEAPAPQEGEKHEGVPGPAVGADDGSDDRAGSESATLKAVETESADNSQSRGITSRTDDFLTSLRRAAINQNRDGASSENDLNRGQKLIGARRYTYGLVA